MEKKAVQINCNYFKYTNEENLLEDFSMEINYGEITLLSGLSGCGKSSLLYLINGIVPRVINADFNGEVLFPQMMVNIRLRDTKWKEQFIKASWN